ncbi:hypothetical protein TeGR_g3035 [Tetraparma gracilis]|nr:hypothetical protein TeGR_g3035 [Tetraparma gracilis]
MASATAMLPTLAEANVPVPWNVYAHFFERPPPRPIEAPRGAPMDLVVLNRCILALQCSLASSTASAAAVESSRITVADVHALLLFQGGLAVEAKKLDYARLLVEDALTLLKVNQFTDLTLSAPAPPASAATGSLSFLPPPSSPGSQSQTFRQAWCANLKALGLIHASQGNLDVALEKYMAAYSHLEINLEPIPVDLLNRITAVNLITGGAALPAAMADSIALARDNLVYNLGEAMDDEFQVFERLYFVHHTQKGSCGSFVRDFMAYAAGTRPKGAIAMHVASAVGCVYNDIGSPKKESSLASLDQFNLGRILQKRGYVDEAVKHLTASAELFTRRGEAHNVYARLILPFIYKSSAEQALAYAGFEHEIASLIENPAAHRTGATAYSMCSHLVTNFDMLPLVRFSTDHKMDELDHLIPLEARGQQEIHHGGMDAYAQISAAFVALCPELVYTNDAVDAMYNLLHKGVEEDEEERRPPPQKKKKTKKVRVGIVSSKLYNHETLKLHGGLLEYLARDESELDVTMACWGTVADEATKRAQKFLTYEKSLNLKSLSQVVSATANSEKVEAYQSLEAEQFDVILFMDLPLDAKSFSLAHRRIAPVQVAVWGHHTYSTQIPETIDYMLVPETFAFGDALPTTATAMYSEQVVLVPGMYIGDPYGAAPGGYLGQLKNTEMLEDMDLFTSTFMIPESANVYVLPCSAPHLSPQFDSVIKDLLRADKDAYVFIGARESTLSERELPEHYLFMDNVVQHGYPLLWGERLKTRMKKKIAGGRNGGGLWRRVRFLDALPSDLYSAVLSLAKVVLDPFPHGNLVPSLEAMYFGTPVVTLGAAHRGGGGGQVKAVYDFIAEKRGPDAAPLNCCDAADEDEYVELAVSLATDSDRRKEVVKGIRGVLDKHMFNTVFEGNEYVAAVEDFLARVGAPFVPLHQEGALKDLYKERVDAKVKMIEAEKRANAADEFQM